MSDSKRSSRGQNKKKNPKTEDTLLDKEIPHDIHTFFQTEALKITKSYLVPAEIVSKFLQHVVRGEEEDIEKMLKENPSLAYEKGDVTDYSGRQFKNVSGFQYALWALDTDMWKMMNPEKNDPEEAKKQLLEVKEFGVTYLPPEPITDEQAEIFKIEDEKERKKIADMMAADQKDKQDHPFIAQPDLMKEMLSYHKPKSKTEHHYDFKLIEALQTYFNYIDQTHKEREEDLDNWTYEDWNKAHTIWERGVGGAQRLVPVHVANQYCRTDSLFGELINNKFSADDAIESLKGHRTIKFCGGRKCWYPLDLDSKRLGVDFAMSKVYRMALDIGYSSFSSIGLIVRGRQDLEAMIVLHRTRQHDIEKLMELLGVSPKKDAKPG